MKLPLCWMKDLTTRKKLSTLNLKTLFKTVFYGEWCQRIVEKQLVIAETLYGIYSQVLKKQTFYPIPRVSLNDPTVLD